MKSLLSKVMEIEATVARNRFQLSTVRSSSETGHPRTINEQRSSLRELFGREQSLNGSGTGSTNGLSREANTKELAEIFRHFISATSEWVGSLVSLMGEEIALDDKVLMLKVCCENSIITKPIMLSLGLLLPSELVRGLCPVNN